MSDLNIMSSSVENKTGEEHLNGMSVIENGISISEDEQLVLKFLDKDSNPKSSEECLASEVLVEVANPAPPNEEPLYLPWDEHLISVHMMVVEQVLKELSDTILDPDFNPEDRHYAGIVQAKQAQLDELDNQVHVYQTVMSRVNDDIHLGKRESYRFCNRLPAFGKRCKIDEWVGAFTSNNRFLIVQGQTGSGKSTQLPQYIADHPRMAGKKIICTQPRKLAAIALAERVALEYAYGNTNSKVGFQVGYSIGGSKPKIFEGQTRIEFMTEGKMLERVMSRRKEDFANIGAIIIDEAHERSIICDILLGTLKKDDPLWNDILIVVSSATIDLKAFDKFFKKRARIIEIAGRMYPVQRIYKPLPEVSAMDPGLVGDNAEIIKAVAETALEIHNSAGTGGGDILCFLPGADEVHRGALWFENNLNLETNPTERLTAKIYELYGLQEADEQKKVFEILDPKIYRKIIFATDIAETSITINGVVYVVDSGVKKEMTFDPKRNISSLKTVSISQSSSLQREGRAGRTQPGVCYKLYSEEDFQKMNVNTLPEIFRRPLPLAIIYLRKMGIDPVNFDWVSAPDPEAIKLAEEELVILGAIEPENKRPTDLGDLISQSQQEPKTVRMIYKGMLKGFGLVAIKIAGLLSVSSSFFFTGGKGASLEVREKCNEKRKSLQHEDGDVVTMLKLYHEYEALDGTEEGEKPDFKKIKEKRTEWLRNNSLYGKALGTADSTVRELKYIFSRTELWKREKSQDSKPSDEEILKLFCSGYFLHAARRVNIKGRGQNRFNYFALEPEVVGSLHYKASLANDGEGLPDWILFDQILKFSETTVFPSSSRIELNWIENENPDFYRKCIEKQTKLPTEIVEIKESETVLRTVLGRRLVNLSRFEEELKCSIMVDLSVGSLRAFCSKASVTYVELFLKTEIERVKDVIINETLPQTWRADTRLVIGPGYEVTSILFPGDFNTFYLRNLNRSMTRERLENYIRKNVNDPTKISSIQLVPQDASCMGIVKFFKSADAAQVFDKLKSELNAIGSDIIVSPHLGDVNAGTVPRAEDVRLKISWALGPSTGVANIIVDSWYDGNRALDLLPYHFPGVKANAIGDLDLTDLTCKKPKIFRFVPGKFRFCEDVTYLVSNFDFKNYQ